MLCCSPLLLPKNISPLPFSIPVPFNSSLPKSLFPFSFSKQYFSPLYVVAEIFQLFLVARCSKLSPRVLLSRNGKVAACCPFAWMLQPSPLLACQLLRAKELVALLLLTWPALKAALPSSWVGAVLFYRSSCFPESIGFKQIKERVWKMRVKWGFTPV